MELSTWGHEEGSPANQTEEVKELTAEEIYYSFKGQTPEEASQYITHLERTLREVKTQLKTVVNEMESNGKLTYYIKKLKKIEKL